MNTQVQNILATNATKTAKIIALLELGYTRKQIAELQVLGKYGAIQNVFAKWQQTGQSETITSPRLSFIPTAFNRKFGVEIEAYGIDKHELARQINRAGINCNVEGYNHTTRQTWKIVTDSSLSGNNTFELVSPPLVGLSGLEQVRTVSAILVRMRAKINQTCGLHIHFDATDMNLQTWKNLVINYANLEHTIDTMMPMSRRHNRFCKTMRERGFENKITNATNLQQIRAVYGDRYRKINLESYARHNTVEFRQHSGTIEIKKIENWILFLHNLLSYSTDFKIENDNFESLKAFNQEDITNFYHQRIQDLNA